VIYLLFLSDDDSQWDEFWQPKVWQSRQALTSAQKLIQNPLVLIKLKKGMQPVDVVVIIAVFGEKPWLIGCGNGLLLWVWFLLGPVRHWWHQEQLSKVYLQMGKSKPSNTALQELFSCSTYLVPLWLTISAVLHSSHSLDRVFVFFIYTFAQFSWCDFVSSKPVWCLAFFMYLGAPCGLRDCKNWPAPFPGRMSYKATKPGLVCLSYLSMLYYCIVIY